MGENKNSATTSDLMRTDNEESGAVKSDATNTAIRTGKVQGSVRKKKKKTAKKEGLSPEVIIQYAGNAAQVEEIVEKVKKLYVADGHYLASLKSLQVYLKPEENAAYYVINKKQRGKIDLF